MAKYGIPYQGSKSGIADSLISFLPSNKRFCDLFGGGAAMTDCAVRSGKYEKVLYNELNPLLPPLIQKAINGDYNYDRFKPEWVSREQFEQQKNKDGYIKYIWSFSNGGKNYLFSQELEPKKRSLHNFVVFGIKDDFIKQYFNDIDKFVISDDIRKRRMLLRRYMQMKQQKRPMLQLERLQQLQQLERLERLQQLEQLERLERLERLEVTCGSYLDYKHKDGDVVYCDPPYEKTAKYSGGFNHKEFYDWVASRPYKVYFSSYQNISDDRFKMIWAKGKTNLMAGASGQKKNYECLYVNEVNND